MENMDKLALDGIYHQGFGIIPKFVMHDQDLTLESKAIYAYLCALAGSGEQTFPYRNTILRDLKVSKDAYYRHYNLLIEQGYISVTRPHDKKSANIYTLIQNPKKLPEQPAQKGIGRLMYRGLKAHGYGSLPRSVMLNNSLSLKAKGLYAYLCSYCGGGNCAFPKKSDILFHLGISEPTYYKALNQLKSAGYLETCQRKDDKGQFGINDYFLNEYPTNTADNPPDGLKSKSEQVTPNKADITLNIETQNLCNFTPQPYTRKPDMKNPCTRKPDTTEEDAISNNSYSKNNSSSNNPSIVSTDEDDGQTGLQATIRMLMEELLEKPPRKNQEAAAAAREYLVRIRKDGDEGSLAFLRERFSLHLGEGLRGKQVRNLKAYCRTALYNWLSEQPVRDEIRPRCSVPREAASYDLGVLEWMVENGDFDESLCGNQ